MSGYTFYKVEVLDARNKTVGNAVEIGHSLGRLPDTALIDDETAVVVAVADDSELICEDCTQAMLAQASARGYLRGLLQYDNVAHNSGATIAAIY